MVDLYESSVHAAYPKVLGAMAVVASLDPTLFDRLKHHLDELYTFEGKVGDAALSLPDADAMRALAAMNEEAKAFYVKLPQELASAMATAKVRPIARRAGAS